MIYFFLVFIISALSIIIFFLYYALYEPYSIKRRYRIFDEVKKEKEFEKIVLNK